MLSIFYFIKVLTIVLALGDFFLVDVLSKIFLSSISGTDFFVIKLEQDSLRLSCNSY